MSPRSEAATWGKRTIRQHLLDFSDRENEGDDTRNLIVVDPVVESFVGTIRPRAEGSDPQPIWGQHPRGPISKRSLTTGGTSVANYWNVQALRSHCSAFGLFEIKSPVGAGPNGARTTHSTQHNRPTLTFLKRVDGSDGRKDSGHLTPESMRSTLVLDAPAPSYLNRPCRHLMPVRHMQVKHIERAFGLHVGCRIAAGRLEKQLNHSWKEPEQFLQPTNGSLLITSSYSGWEVTLGKPRLRPCLKVGSPLAFFQAPHIVQSAH